MPQNGSYAVFPITKEQMQGKKAWVGMVISCHNGGGKIKTLEPIPVCYCGGKVVDLKDSSGQACHPGSTICCESIIEALRNLGVNIRMAVSVKSDL